MLRLILILTVLILTTYCLNSQNRTLQPTVFTWEGAAEGNKAVWNADDTLNTYLDIGFGLYDFFLFLLFGINQLLLLLN